VAGTPAWKVHQLKARETSQEPLALGQMLENPRRGFSPEKILVCFVIKGFEIR